MKRKYGVMIATWILWFISVLVPLFCMVLQRVPQRFLTIQFLVILLLGILLCVQWIWLRRAERIQNTAVRGEIEGAGMAALQSMTVPMILAERDGKILWSNAIFQSRFVSGLSVLGRSVQDVIHLNLAALDQNRDLLMEHNGLSYRVHAVSSVQNQQEIIAVQFLEITDILRLQHEQTNSRPCGNAAGHTHFGGHPGSRSADAAVAGAFGQSGVRVDHRRCCHCHRAYEHAGDLCGKHHGHRGVRHALFVRACYAAASGCGAGCRSCRAGGPCGGFFCSSAQSFRHSLPAGAISGGASVPAAAHGRGWHHPPQLPPPFSARL